MTPPIRPGARLSLPRDLQIAYTVARMGAVTATDLGPLFWGAASTARWGLGRLVKLGLLRTFDRPNLALPQWYSLTPEGLEWVQAETGAETTELRRFAGLSRVNLAALQMRNRFWVSLILASRAHQAIELTLVRPEWELRREKRADVAILPDVLLVLGPRSTDGPTPDPAATYLVELDSGAERRAVWQAKARAYAALRGRGPVYGVSGWSVLALLPTIKRARSVATALVEGGAGGFTLLGVASDLERGRAFNRVLTLAGELASGAPGVPARSLLDPLHAAGSLSSGHRVVP